MKTIYDDGDDVRAFISIDTCLDYIDWILMKDMEESKHIDTEKAIKFLEELHNYIFNSFNDYRKADVLHHINFMIDRNYHELYIDFDQLYEEFRKDNIKPLSYK